jgi:hypothetical protein
VRSASASPSSQVSSSPPREERRGHRDPRERSETSESVQSCLDKFVWTGPLFSAGGPGFLSYRLGIGGNFERIGTDARARHVQVNTRGNRRTHHPPKPPAPIQRAGAPAPITRGTSTLLPSMFPPHLKSNRPYYYRSRL